MDPTPPNLAAAFLIGNWFWAYGLLASRTPKQYLGIDHNASPRQDLAQYGSTISPRTLAMLKRWEGAQANSIEGYAFFAASVLFALHAGVEKARMNGFMALYSLSRVVYATAYITIESDGWSRIRSYSWWIGNLSCVGLIYFGGKKL